MSFLKRSLK